MTARRAKPVRGIRLGSTDAGIRYKGRDDLTVIEIAPGSAAAAMFTRNRFCAAPVIVAREHLTVRSPRYLLINAGNANAGTGDGGILAARQTCARLAELVGCSDAEVLPFSTGVIGEPLPVSRLSAALPAALTELKQDGWTRAARAIMTTDTVPKIVSVPFSAGGTDYVATGIAKGAGMIRPDMATMLAFIATDAPLSVVETQQCLRVAVDRSFNRITVDGDTSTNDAVVLAATGLARRETPHAAVTAAAAAAIGEVSLALAHAIVRDAEGAGKFITVRVSGGATEADCLAVAYTIAHSPLVKTALSASDPNWGRILAAVGRAPVADLDVSRVCLSAGKERILTNGEPDPGYTEAKGVAAMSEPDIELHVTLGRGDAEAVVWTCDLTADYVRINAAYRS
jgi:glutamate N-acetyltransferase/amino-acid N-acetyltransferase